MPAPRHGAAARPPRSERRRAWCGSAAAARAALRVRGGSGSAPTAIRRAGPRRRGVPMRLFAAPTPHPSPTPTASGRDARVDLFRGYALLAIFIDHVTGSFLGLLTLHIYGFSDAAEIFVLLAGFASM